MTDLQTPSDLTQEQPLLLTWARSLVIANHEQLSECGVKLQHIKGAAKKIQDWFKPLKQKADEAKRALLDKEKELVGPLAEAETLAKTAMLSFQQNQEAIQREEQRKRQAEIDERARIERETLEFEAAFSTDPVLKAKAEADAARVVAPLVTVPEAPKVNGVQTRKVWKARVTNIDLIPREFLIVDQKKLDAYARAMKEAARVSGVEFYAEESLAIRTCQ